MRKDGRTFTIPNLLVCDHEVTQSEFVAVMENNTSNFNGSSGKEPSGDILDLHTLSLCDRIVGPWSTYSRWASFIGEVPLCFIEERNQDFTDESFSVVTDFYHFTNGRNTENFWRQGNELL